MPAYRPAWYGFRSTEPVRFRALELFHAHARLTPTWHANPAKNLAVYLPPI